MDKECHSKNIPLISIIVPVYNSAPYLNKCLDSIARQSFKDWECVLVNDGSTDKSGEICREFEKQDDRFVLINQPNSGVSRARNNGIERARGKFITFVDSDDYIKEDYLLAFLRCHPQEKSLTISGLISKNRYEEYISFKYEDSLNISDNINELIVKNDLLKDGGPVNKLFDLNLIRYYNLRFDESLSYHEDHIFVYTYYLYLKEINLTSYCGYYYMYYGEQSNNSLSRLGKKNVSKLLDASEIFLKLVDSIARRFNIMDEKYLDMVRTRTGYSQILLALYNGYRNHTINPRMLLRKYCPIIRSFRNKYSPKSWKRKILILILCMPPVLSHILMGILIKISKQY